MQLPTFYPKPFENAKKGNLKNQKGQYAIMQPELHKAMKKRMVWMVDIIF